VQEFNLQRYKQHTPNIRDAAEHIILHKLSKETKASYLCGKDYWKALYVFGTIIKK
jgi:hypothetical protein